MSDTLRGAEFDEYGVVSFEILRPSSDVCEMDIVYLPPSALDGMIDEVGAVVVSRSNA